MKISRLNCDIISASPKKIRVNLIRGVLNRDGVNASFSDSLLNPLGVVVIDGKVITDRVLHRPPRPVFVIYKNGTADILQSVERASDLDLSQVKYAVGAGPFLSVQGLKEGGFQPDILRGRRLRSAVGITNSGDIRLVVTDLMSLTELMNLMTLLNCVKAMNLDGGSSSSMFWKGRMVRGGVRTISTAITLK